MLKPIAMLLATIGVGVWLGEAHTSPAAANTAIPRLAAGVRQAMRADESAARARVQMNQLGREIPPEFLGFSYEAPVLTDDHFEVRNAALATLLSHLGRGTLRYGAHSVEFTAWSRTARARQPDERGVVTPSDLDRLFDFATLINWRVILGLNFAHGDPTVSADEAAYAVGRGGSRLLALEIGNEPDLYLQIFHLRPESWDYPDFRREFETFLHAIHGRAPRAPIAGPGTARDVIAGPLRLGPFLDSGPAWFPNFVKDEGPALLFATHHIYPMIAGSGIPPESLRYPSIANMLSASLMQRVSDQVHQLAVAAAANHLALRVTETNSAARGGQNGVSNVFAAALWGTDYAFTLAEAGADGLNFHGAFACQGYTPICRSGTDYMAQPLYYGMLLFHAALPGRIVPVSVQSTTNLVAHAVLGHDGRLALVLINKDPQRSLRVEVEALEAYRRATLLRLRGQALDSGSSVTFGEHAIAADGSWAPGAGEAVEREGHVFEVHVPAASALLARFEK
jgi:hypothetical protein